MPFLIALLSLLVACTSPSDKVYQIGRDPSWYPLNLPGKEASVLGFTDDLLTQVLKNEHINISLKTLGWNDLFDQLALEKVDAICSSLPAVLRDASLYSFSEPYLAVGPILVVREESTIDSLKAMKGQEIGFLYGSSSVVLLDAYEALVPRFYSSYPLALEDLVEGRIDALVMPVLLAEGYVRDLYQGLLKVVGAPLDQEALRVLTLAGENRFFIESFNKGLEAFKESGAYEALLQKWQLK